MPLYDKRIQGFYTALDTFFSIMRILGQSSFRRTHHYERKKDKLLVLGNGPSLIPTLEQNKDKLVQYDLMVVNFAGITPLFTTYKPNLYVLADPAFWFNVESEETKQKVRHLYESIASNTTWDMTLYIPHTAKKSQEIEQRLSRNSFIHIRYYNSTKFEGFTSLSHRVYSKQWGMPRAQNVLIAAMMLGIYFQYPAIVLAGADNDWIHNLWVDKNNNVRLNDTHFYNPVETNSNARILSGSISEQMLSQFFTFNSYMLLSKYSNSMKITISNTNNFSYIDSFSKGFNL